MANKVKVFMMKLSEIQPIQLYICSEKLSEVMKTFDANNPMAMEPIPVKRLGDDVIFVDGHTRAFAALLHGFSEVPVYWEDEELTGTPIGSVSNGVRMREYAP